MSNLIVNLYGWCGSASNLLVSDYFLLFVAFAIVLVSLCAIFRVLDW